MAIDISTGSTRSYFTGYASLKIVAINPTKEELNGMGIPAQEEPVYTKNVPSRTNPNELVPQTRLEFHYAGAPGSGLPEGFTARNSLFIRYEMVADFYINRFGRFANSVKNPSAYQALFADNGQPRLALDGEMDLMMQLESLCNPRKGKEFKLDTYEQIAYYGDVTELKKTLTDAANNTVQGVLGVQTSNGKQYQTVYKRIQPSWSTKLEYIQKALAEHAPHNKDTYYGPLPDLAVRPYNPAADPFAAASASAVSTAPPVQAAPKLPPPPSAIPVGGAAPAPQATQNAAPAPQHIASPSDKQLPF